MTRARDVANLIGSGNYSSTTFTATAGQTVFSIAHTQNFVQVFMNGLLLDLTADYTSNGSAVTLTSGAAAGDEIEVVAYNTFSVGDALNQAAADTRYVNTTGDTMTGALTVGGAVTINPDADSSLEIKDGGTNALFMTAATGDELYIGANGTYAIRIKSDGTKDVAFDNGSRVTMPSQPYIELRGSSNSEVNSSGTTTTYKSWTSQSVSGGITWNNSNGRITVPIAGKYLFAAKFFQWMDNTTYHYIHVRKNGTVMQEYGTDFTHTGGGGRTDHSITTNDIFTLAANDYIDFNVNADIYGGPIYTNCQVRLLG